MTPRSHQIWIALVLTILIAGAVGAASDREGFEQLLDDYEAIRMALLNDTLDGVGMHAEALGHHAESNLEHRMSHGHGAMGEDAEAYRTALETISQATKSLAAAEDLSSARSAMFELTKPMVQIRELVGEESTIVAYCPMAKKSWIQAAGDLENPYLGQAMPTCGEVVSQ